jgi:hypothetical protein
LDSPNDFSVKYLTLFLKSLSIEDMTTEQHLISIFDASRDSFHEKLRKAKEQSSTCIWASGPWDVITIESDLFRDQIHGIAPGKILQAPSKLSKDTIIYHLDTLGRPTYKTLYANRSNNRWIVYIDIYEYREESVIRYCYGSHFEDTDDLVDLQKIIEIMPPPPKPVQIVNEILEFQKECTTTAYTYDERGDIQEMITTWLSNGSKKIIKMQ